MSDFVCKICGKSCKNNFSLGAHIKNMHYKDTVKKPQKIHCQICDRDIGAHAWGLHVKRKHNIDVQNYYDTFLKMPDEGKCINCGKPTPFYSMTLGYAKTCSQLCQKQHVWNNLTDEQKSQSIMKDRESVKNYIKNRPTEQSSKIMKKLHNSQVEQDIRNVISSVYSKQVIGPIKSKKYIYPYELDIVLPDIKLAIEYNGLYAL